MLKDLDQRNSQFSGAGETALRGFSQDDTRSKNTLTKRFWSIKYLLVTFTIMLAGLSIGGTSLLQSAQAPILSRFEAATIPRSQQSAMTANYTLHPDSDTSDKDVPNSTELVSVSSQNSDSHQTAVKARAATPQSPSSADSLKRFQSAKAPIQSRMDAVILPRYILPSKSMSTPSEARSDTIEENRSHKTIEPIASASQTSGTPPRTVKDNTAAKMSVSSSDAPGTEKSAQIEVTHRPLSLEQQLLSDLHAATMTYKEGNYIEAGRLLENLLARDNGQHKARLLLARLYAQQKLVRRAELVLSNGLLHFPRHAPYVSLYAQMLAEQGRDIAAIDALQNALPGANDNAGFHALLAGLYQRNGNAAAAVESYLVALRLEPTHGEWWMGLGISSEQAGDEDTAGKAYNEALQHLLAGEVEQYAEQRLQQLSAKSVASNIQDNK